MYVRPGRNVEFPDGPEVCKHRNRLSVTHPSRAEDGIARGPHLFFHTSIKFITHPHAALGTASANVPTSGSSEISLIPELLP